MGASQATINVRMDPALKERGDVVLRRHGLTTSNVVRQLWEELARTREVPDFLLRGSSAAEQAERRRKGAVLRSLVGAAKAPVPDAALDYDALIDAQYDDVLKRYLELS